ncbi:hypothetical protein NA655_09910 [Pseudomonas kuykendallii]|uniref:Uncharacterized protein n=1 Tax=Pseudomonas kuykendallii TaxID=1007099 RepID=A0A1H2V2F5_9PSED|nr:hypothetical protein [Pseudomonas kuykendallii]MCQ4271336.1 hypothetical protein [Pseudomonas kuykendallii]SDW62471.1 hypothetical protein SAMN05216287_1098 [Pseudomonas kuykendallii]
MQVDFFETLGQMLGSLIRFIVDSLDWLFSLFAVAGHNFVDGLAAALGMDRSILNIAALVLGLILLVGAFRAFFRRSIISGIILLLLALWLLSFIIN